MCKGATNKICERRRDNKIQSVFGLGAERRDCLSLSGSLFLVTTAGTSVHETW